MENDFSKGSVVHNILSLAFPMMVAQLINVLYNIVDRIYIGHLPEDSTLALTGIGLTLPIVTAVIAFANLFGMGGAPLCSIARGEGNTEKAERIMGNSFSLLLIFGFFLTILGLLFKNPLLYLFGASNETFSFANEYITVYLLGTIFVMTSLGMNNFINAQGFGKVGMASVLVGAISNIILDPIFIFVLDMGVKGAAIATISSQFLSAIWVLSFLRGKKAILVLKMKYFKLDFPIVKKIVALGLSGFVMAITNSGVQIVCNVKLSQYGGDLYVGAMTIINSIREVIFMPVSGLTNGAQPVMGYNYGAKYYERVKASIKFLYFVCITYTLLAWGILISFPEFFVRMFNKDQELVFATIPALKTYFFGFFMMSLQFSGQAVFVALGKAKHAIFFSLLRKVIIVIPLTLLLPGLFNLGVNGVFIAEPISNFIGGIASFIAMLLTVWPKLKSKEKDVSI